MTRELATTFDPASIEARWYSHWEDKGLFRPERADAEPFTIVNPPPNVTGKLHIGHALDNTLQDIMIRYERLRGKDALWVVGVDHAGIATQMVVERRMEAAGDKRSNYSREEFIDKVWEWKHESGGEITGQLRRLGCSMDWSREQFTMDPHFTSAVTKVFVDLHKDGLIYRDKRLVNWDPKLKTAISDLEVETRDEKGSFWHFKYPLASGAKLDDGRDYIEVATTRPETMLADMAVAVHPSDERYKSVVGSQVKLPITGRLVTIVADEHADPELGSGAVKITPGHDFNDFDVGKRAGFKPADMLNMLTEVAAVCQVSDGLIPEKYLGQDRFDARAAVVADLKELGFLIPHITKTKKGEEVELDAEPRTIATPFGDRGGVVIEPWLTDQWYVNAEELAKAPMASVRNGDIEIIPQTWEKTFFNWMENIQPWCVSRQLWWGHQIPAWYGTTKEALEALQAGDIQKVEELTQQGKHQKIFVLETKEEAFAAAQDYYGQDYFVHFGEYDAEERGDRIATALTRDNDVLDTWFSSALWPFATLGWPDENAPLFKKHYPNDLLVSGFDILFFWDARMAMMGQHLTGKDPWKKLYLHGLVRAADGQKMSKSKGNVVDPLILIDKYGADALRFFMAAMESQGRDIKMDDKRVEGYRNFATKLWNAARLLQARGVKASSSLKAPKATTAVNKWIIGEVVETVSALDNALGDLRFDAAANIIYHFTWDNFCNWYLEFIKPIVTATNLGSSVDADTRAIAEETLEVAGWVLDQILVMLHPFMPFITEELWDKLALGNTPAPKNTSLWETFLGFIKGLGRPRALENSPKNAPRDYELILAKWPAPQASVNNEAKAEVEYLIALTSGLRTAKNELGIPPGTKLEAWMENPSAKAKSIIAANGPAVERLARLSAVHFDAAPTGAAMQIGVGEDNLTIPLEGLVDIDAEKARLEKALAVSAKEAKSLEGRLGNENFVARAKPEAVEKAKADLAHHSAEVGRLTAAMARLG